MKKILFVMPLAILLANCTTSRNTSRSGSTGTNGSASSTTSTNMTTETSSLGASTGTPATGTSGSTGSYATGTHYYDPSVYDPNNLMQNPEKYKTPFQLGKEGGWTYLSDWRVNTNFSPEAVGQWQLVPTPEVAAFWMADMNKPENYAAYWTPEAVQFRYDASMAAINDSIMKANGGSGTTGSVGSAGSSATATSGTANTTGTGTAGSTTETTSMTTGSTTAGSTSGTMSGATGSAATGSTSGGTTIGTTGTTTQGTDATSTSSGNNFIATNGNRFMMPKLNLYIENGSFTGYTGCNNIVGALTVNAGQLHFNETVPSTNIQCSGGFDQSAYMDRIRRADSYDVVNNQLRLKQGSEVLLVFTKNAQ